MELWVRDIYGAVTVPSLRLIGLCALDAIQWFQWCRMSIPQSFCDVGSFEDDPDSGGDFACAEGSTTFSVEAGYV